MTMKQLKGQRAKAGGWVAVVLLAVALAVWVRGLPGRAPVEPPQAQPGSAAAPRPLPSPLGLEQGTLQVEDGTGQRWVLTVKGVHAAADGSQAWLEPLEARYYQNGRLVARLAAQGGTLQGSPQVLELQKVEVQWLAKDSSPAPASGPPGPRPAAWSIRGRTLRWLAGQGRLVLSGPVQMSGPDGTARSQEAVLFPESGRVELRGRVEVRAAP
ncbi:MAG: hypothetical protein IMW99_05625 [Firmicutes bacterium]|nr:hypothetical protein [Bacillota bacterium]